MNYKIIKGSYMTSDTNYEIRRTVYFYGKSKTKNHSSFIDEWFNLPLLIIQLKPVYFSRTLSMMMVFSRAQFDQQHIFQIDICVIY